MSPLTNTIVSAFESVCILGSIAGRENICYSFPTRRRALTEDTLLISVPLMQTTALVSYPHALNPESLNHATPAMRFTTANIIIGKSVGPAHWCSSPTMVGFYCTRQRKDIWPMWFSSEKNLGPRRWIWALCSFGVCVSQPVNQSSAGELGVQPRWEIDRPFSGPKRPQLAIQWGAIVFNCTSIHEKELSYSCIFQKRVFTFVTLSNCGDVYSVNRMF